MPPIGPLEKGGGRRAHPVGAGALAVLSRLTLKTLGAIKMNRAERATALDAMLDYLELHNIVRAASLKSPDVLHSLFA